MSHYCQAYRSVGLFFFFHCSHITVDMIWRHLVLLGVSVVLLMRVECRIKEGKTLTFRRTQHSESQGQMRRRPRRDASSSPDTSKPLHGPPFTSCRLLLTPAEHEVLDDNTHEVSCSLVNIGRCDVRRAFLFNVKKEIPGLWSWYQFLFVFCNA